MYTAVRKLLDVPKAEGHIFAVIYVEEDGIMKASNCKDAEAHKGQLHAVADSPSLPWHFEDPDHMRNHQPGLSPVEVSLCSWKALDLWERDD